MDKFLEPISKLEQELIKAVEESKSIKIEGIEDSKGYAAAKKHRANINRTIKLVKDTRKDLTKPLDDKKKEAIALETRLVGICKPEKERIDRQIKEYEAEKARIKAEEQRKKQERLQERIDRMQSVGAHIDIALLTDLDDASFETLYEQAHKQYESKIAFEQARQEDQIDGIEQPATHVEAGFVKEGEDVISKKGYEFVSSTPISPTEEDSSTLKSLAKTIQGYNPKADVKSAEGANLLNWFTNQLHALGKELEQKAGGLHA